MRFPVVRERVRVQDRSGTFLVLSVDRAMGVAEVVSTIHGGHIESVLLASVIPLSRTDPHLKLDPQLGEYA